MDLEQLKTFVHTVWDGGFTRAAITLDITQSSVSARISRLEQEVGHPLFQRRGNRMELTRHGQLFLPFAERMIGAAAETRAELDELEQLPNLQGLTLGANHVAAVALLPHLLLQLRQRCSDPADLRLDVIVAGTRVLMPSLMEGAIELAFANPTFAHSGCNVLWSSTSPVALVAAPSHPLAEQTVTTDRLEDEPFVTYRLGIGPTIMQHLEKQTGTPVHSLLGSNNTDLVLSLITEGMGIGFVPRACATSRLDAGMLREITVEDLVLPDWQIALVRWGVRDLSPVATEFVDLLRAGTLAGMDG